MFVNFDHNAYHHIKNRLPRASKPGSLMILSFVIGCRNKLTLRIGHIKALRHYTTMLYYYIIMKIDFEDNKP